MQDQLIHDVAEAMLHRVRQGWCKYISYDNTTTHVCMVGAFQYSEAAVIMDKAEGDPNLHEAMLLNTLANVIRDQYPGVSTSRNSLKVITDFNDSICTTQADVELVLEKVIADAS